MGSAADALARLRQAQAALNAASAESWDDEEDDGPPRRLDEPDLCCARLGVTDLGGVLAVDYYGSDYAGFPEAMEALAEPGVAEHIAVLRIDGPDMGANGTRELDFTPLLDARPGFTRLRDLVIAPHDPGAHNQIVVMDDQLPLLLALMPAIGTLTLPHAPEPGFFDLDLPRLRRIRTGPGFRTHGFIDRLAGAARLPSLGFVDFSDSLTPYMTPDETDPAWQPTAFDSYERLFRSGLTERMSGLRLRNAMLTGAQYQALQVMRPRLQFSVVMDTPHVYVSHWDGGAFAYRHLLPLG